MIEEADLVAVLQQKCDEGVPWSQLQPLVLKEINNPERTDGLAAALTVLEEVADSDICVFMASKDGVTMMKSAVVTSNDGLRALVVEGLGRIVLRVWLLLHDSIDLEAVARFESASEAKRMKEDFLDAAVEFFQHVAKGAIGNASNSDGSQLLEDSYEAMSSHCEVIVALLKSYFSPFYAIEEWSAALLGASGSASAAAVNSIAGRRKEKSLCLLRLVIPVLKTVFEDPYLLTHRLRTSLVSKDNAAVDVVTYFVLILLSELPPDGSPDTVVELTSLDHMQSIFSIRSGNDPTGDSRNGRSTLHLLRYSTEWLDLYLMYILNNSVDTMEIVAVAKDIIMITQHRLLIAARSQV